MNRKHYWGLAILILIIGVVGVYFMLQPEPEPEKRYILPSEAENKQAKDVNKPQLPVSKDAKPPPPGASPNRHWHNGEWHDESHQQIVDVETLSTEEAASDHVWTIEAVQEFRESQLKHLPKQIEVTKNLVESLERTYKLNSESVERLSKDGGYVSPLLIQLRDQDKERLDYNRGYLSRIQEDFEGLSQPDGLEYQIKRLGLEELLTEVDNEK